MVAGSSVLGLQCQDGRTLGCGAMMAEEKDAWGMGGSWRVSAERIGSVD